MNCLSNVKLNLICKFIIYTHLTLSLIPTRVCLAKGNNSVDTISKNTKATNASFKNGKYRKRYQKSKKRRISNEFYTKNNLKTVSITAQPVLFSSYTSQSLFSSSRLNPNTIRVKPYTDPREALNNSGNAFNTPFGQIDWTDISTKMYLVNNKYYTNYNGYKLELTLDPQLQEASEKYLNRTRILNGSTAIIDPKTGKILSLSQNGGNRNAIVSVSSRAPAASLMKIITASAAIEKKNLNPYDEIKFRGGCSNLRNGNWLADPARDRQKMTFAKAFGISCNTVFARLALYDVGLSSLKVYAEKFMFNKSIPSDIRLQTSMFLLPDPDTATPLEVAEAGAGFGATKLSPVHAALLSAAVNNKGVMMAPYLVEAAFNSNGKEVYRAKPIQIARVISQQTAIKIETLMLATISSGTSRRTFRKRGTRADADEIGGKTGTLLDPENRDVLYTWFSGIAPLNSPNSIAIGTVVASPQNWVVRASSVAQTTLADYLRFEREESRVASRND